MELRNVVQEDPATEHSSGRSKSDARELPASLRGKEVPVTGTYVACRTHAASAPQNHLSAHEFSVVFTERTVERREPWVAKVSTPGPLPTVTKELNQPLPNVVWLC